MEEKSTVRFGECLIPGAKFLESPNDREQTESSSPASSSPPARQSMIVVLKYRRPAEESYGRIPPQCDDPAAPELVSVYDNTARVGIPVNFSDPPTLVKTEPGSGILKLPLMPIPAIYVSWRSDAIQPFYNLPDGSQLDQSVAADGNSFEDHAGFLPEMTGDSNGFLHEGLLQVYEGNLDLEGNFEV
ncbi:uncharacterized protein ATNIH1004_003148 [Aspergillus tanneri]|uniref:Uncharacterized protein n=1 Tax=Aspergillus tanneri TaxID=1220188 RepID=A0A5M9MTL6_9EURO|nr:uncharacterized protein ATNIH1004_003148 [Aspergillus tanneri]KAA8650462.1 hypothetical protein ATNIH1004_003148 [Aspergillus tanneri]